MQVSDKGTVYPCAQILVNVTNSYDTPEPEPEMVELAKFAKHHIPEKHEKVFAEVLMACAYFCTISATELCFHD